MSLSRMEWTAQRVKHFIHRTQKRRWPTSITARQRYLLERAYAMHRWSVERRRKNRHSARVVASSAFDDAAEADGDVDEDRDEDRDEEDGADAQADENEDDGPIGRAEDGSDDGEMELVLLVQARSRSPQHLTITGRFDAIATQYEIVPKNRVRSVLESVFHASGSLFTTAATLYRRLAETYIGIAHRDVIDFLARAETAVLSRSNSAGDAIIAPSMPTRLGQRWAADLTFADSTLPLAPYIGFMTVIDALSRFTWVQPIADKSAATVASMLESLYMTEGPPEMLQLDNTMEHHSESVRLVCQRNGVQLRFTRPYRSEENGQVEVAHKTIKQLLRKLVIDTQSGGQAVDPVALLASAVRMYNASPNSVTQISPFLLWRGRPPAKLQAPLLLGDDDGAGESAAAAAVQRGQSGAYGRGGRRRSLTGSVSTGRGAGGVRRELRELMADQSAREESERQASRLRRQNAAAAVARPAPSIASSRASRTQWRDAPAAAVRERLGLGVSQRSDREAAQELSQQRAAASSSSSSAAANPAGSLTGTGGEWRVGRILAVVHDAITGQLLYGVRWAPPYDDVTRDVFVPASWIGGATDAQVTAFVKRTQKDSLPVVFTRAFRGPPTLDRKRAIPFSVVLSEVGAEDVDEDGQVIGNPMRESDTAGQERVLTLPKTTTRPPAAAATAQWQANISSNSSAAAAQINSGAAYVQQRAPMVQAAAPHPLAPRPQFAMPNYAPAAPMLTPQQLQYQQYVRQVQMMQQAAAAAAGQQQQQQQQWGSWGMPPPPPPRR